jgi:hypothetical protein
MGIIPPLFFFEFFFLKTLLFQTQNHKMVDTNIVSSDSVLDSEEANTSSPQHASSTLSGLLKMLDLNENQQYPVLYTGFFPKEQVSKLSDPEREILLSRIITVLRFVDFRRFKKGTKYKTKTSIYTCISGACSRSGKPTLSKAVMRNQIESQRCGCNAKVVIFADGMIEFNLNHHEGCKPDIVIDSISEDPRLFIASFAVQHPGLKAELIKSAHDLIRGDWSLKPRNVRRQVRERLRERGYADVPASFVRSIFDKAKCEALDGVPIHESMQSLLDQVSAKGLKHKKKRDDDNKLTALHIHIPEIAPPEDQEYAVLVADVTHNIVDARSGFNKTSFITAISPKRSAYVVVTSLILKEDEATFMNELHFLLELDPSLKDREIVFLVDGDRGRIAAIRSLLPKARVFLCMWHKLENIKDHFGPVLRAQATPEQSVKDLKAELKRLSIPLNGAKLKSQLLALLKNNSSSTISTSQNQEDIGPKEEDDEDEAASDVENDPDKLHIPPEVIENSDIDTFPDIKRFDQFSCLRVFKYLRSGKNHEDCEARLNHCAEVLPQLREYIDGELRSTMIYWADWARVWGLTFGLVASTIQENVHWSLKSRLEGACIPPHQLITFLTSVLCERQVKIDLNRKSNKKIQALKRDLSRFGFESVVTSVETYATIEGQDLILAEFDAAQGYDVKEVVDLSSLPSDRRGASALRFSMLLEVSEEGRLFEVKNRAHGGVDLVHIAANGTLACTCGDVHSLGAPDRHVFAVYRTGKMLFNPFLHLHPIYLNPKKTKSKFFQAASVGNIDAELIDQGCAWDDAKTSTEHAWRTKGIGSAGVSALIYSPAKKKVAESLSRQEKLDKMYYPIRARVKHDEELFEEFERLMEKLNARDDLPSNKKSRLDSGEILPVGQRKESSHRIRKAKEKTSAASKSSSNQSRRKGARAGVKKT